jgi:hypothetical protein
MHGICDLARREQRLIGRELNLAGDPLKFRKVGLIKRAADAERADGAGRAAAETCPIRRDGSYHCPYPFTRRIDAPSLPVMTDLPEIYFILADPPFAG